MDIILNWNRKYAEIEPASWGASGNRKSYLGCAFGIPACRNYHTVKYIRLPDLLDELTVARGEGMFKEIIRQHKKVDLLTLDEWLLTPLD